MKIDLVARRRVRANVLVLTLLLLVLLALAFGSYLQLVGTQNLLGTESQAWNAALHLAEAGAEEGMAQVNVAYGSVVGATNYVPSIQTNWVTQSWSAYTMSNSALLTGGSYSVTVLATNPGPIITATGFTEVPFVGRPLTRTVQLNTAPLAFFGRAMAALSGITTKGNKLTVDSYDSADPAHSTNGMYNAATRKAGGDIASVAGTIDVQNANIYGHADLGPTATFTLNNGTVGDLNWLGPGVETGWLANDFNMAPADVVTPYSSGLTVPFNSKDPNNTYPLTTGSYYVNGDFVMSQNQTMVVSGTATLYVTGNFNMKAQNNCLINILPGGSLTLYVGTPNGSPVSTSLTQVNLTGNALNFRFFGLPSNTSLVWNGNNTFVGTVYAPESDFSCGGGGNNTYDYQGACLVRTVTMNGKFNFHYDENLKRSGPWMGYTVTCWKEL